MAPPPQGATRTVAAHAGTARELIHLLKFNRVLPAAAYWAARMAPLAATLPAEPEVVVPIPLAPHRQRERGFNQSAEMARPLARHLGAEYRPRALERTRETTPQAGLDAEARLRNLQGAFRARQPRRLAGRHVLLVDDVLTTGTTMTVAAGAVLEAGAASVSVLVATRAELHHGVLARGAIA